MRRHPRFSWGKSASRLTSEGEGDALVRGLGKHSPTPTNLSFLVRSYVCFWLARDYGLNFMLVLSLLRLSCVTLLIYLALASSSRVTWFSSLPVINGRRLYIAGGMNICLAVETAHAITTSGPHLLELVHLLSDYLGEGLPTCLSSQHAAGFGSTQYMRVCHRSVSSTQRSRSNFMNSEAIGVRRPQRSVIGRWNRDTLRSAMRYRVVVRRRHRHD